MCSSSLARTLRSERLPATVAAADRWLADMHVNECHNRGVAGPEAARSRDSNFKLRGMWPGLCRGSAEAARGGCCGALGESPQKQP